MSYFIAIDTLNGRKPINRTLHPIKREAVAEAERLNSTAFGSFSVMDADHEPGKSILLNRCGI